MLDHPRPTKVVVSLVNREAGILRGMLVVAHMFDSAWSTRLARILSLKYWLVSGREWALLRSTVTSQASISTRALMMPWLLIAVVEIVKP